MENIYVEETNPLETLTFTVTEIRIAHGETQVFNRSCTHAELRDEINALNFYNKDKDPSEQLDLIDFLMSDHTITWGVDDDITMVTVTKRNKEVKP